ncbi:hypothetical protein LWI29_011222 [Acer saccharum]|uniref:Uncharacterized protein n=1 Tax=Acer saccharum TaxID=4024 RepID=A0AA39SDN3_ACESA|nr:hypothetical protein LWI29_011222 [Acer saccharum]
MTSLMDLDLSLNQITAISKSFREMCSLKTLNLYYNNLTAQLPELFLDLSGCTRKTLKSLKLGGNNLSGSIPDITQFPSLRELQIFDNRLDGIFPEKFGQLSPLSTLNLDGNQIWGSLPDFSIFPLLRCLDISDNQLNGSISEGLRQLSKLCDSFEFQLEDNVWDDFGGSDDHIVLHLNGTGGNNLPLMTKKDKMLKKESWSHTPDSVFPASCDSDTVKEVTSTASDDTRISSHGSKSDNANNIGDFSADDPILDDGCDPVDNNLYSYPLNHISQTENDLSFLNNDREDKESSDLLYYGWPDIGNFEDVDRMFSCDSTFGLGSLSNEDDLCWFSSSNAAEESEDILKSGSKLSTLPEHQKASRENGGDPSANDPSQKIFVADTQSETKDGSIFNEQINLHKKQLKHQNKLEGQRKDQLVENGGLFPQYDNLKQLTDMENPFGDSLPQVFPASGLQQRKRNIGGDSLSYIQTDIPYMHLDYHHPSDQISVCPTPSGTKSENNSHLSPSPKESSYASNQVQSMESSHGPSFEAPSVTTNEKREKLYHCKDLQVPFTRNFKHANMASPMTFCNSPSIQKQHHQSECEIGDPNGGVSIGVPAELDSLNAQESSCMSTVLDEVSLEATSFHQLQRVTEKLDIRTKLCIRDSLYRLARSAEQRHNCANSNGSSIRDDRDSSGALMAVETNKCTEFIDMETDTNPIDRSIAHLLFHRPSDPSIMHANDALPFKSHAVIHESINSLPMKAEKQVCREDTTMDAGKLLTGDDDK